MKNYLPSLEDRKRKLIEDCIGCAGGGDNNFDSEPPMGETDPIADATPMNDKKRKAAKLDVAMNRINKRKRKV